MKSVEEFLSSYPAEISNLAGDLRAFVRAVVPDAEETLHLGWRSITFRNTKAFCSIIPHKKWVNLQFQNGNELSDPAELLEGTGKSMRHVKIRDAADLGEALKDLIRGASTLAE